MVGSVSVDGDVDTGEGSLILLVDGETLDVEEIGVVGEVLVRLGDAGGDSEILVVVSDGVVLETAVDTTLLVGKSVDKDC